MLKRYRYRAYPTAGQAAHARRLFGCVRVAWNDALAAREHARREGTPVPSRAQLSAALTAAKRTPERAWLAQVSSVPLQQALADLDRAYRNFFDSRKGKRRGPKVHPPRFKKRSNRQSARFTRNAGFAVTHGTRHVAHVRLPKIGRIRFTLSRPLPSEPTSVTLIAEPDGRWYVSFVIDEPAREAPVGQDRPVAGVDLGLADLAVIARTDGTREKITNPRWLRTRQRRLSRAQRALSRKQPGSANAEKARHRVAVEHRKVREARADHHHKLALRLVRENQAVAVEGLSVAALARTRMAKSIHDAGWGLFLRLLREKAPEHGCTIAVADRWAPTTQTCAACGTPGGRKPLAVREWTCVACGIRLDRDWNAAVNVILAAGLAESLNACRGSVRRQLAAADPKKQEPTELAGVA